MASPEFKELMNRIRQRIVSEPGVTTVTMANELGLILENDVMILAGALTGLEMAGVVRSDRTDKRGPAPMTARWYPAAAKAQA